MSIHNEVLLPNSEQLVDKLADRVADKVIAGLRLYLDTSVPTPTPG